jgi:hypothetical protein
MTAKTEILEAAHRLGWNVDNRLGWSAHIDRTAINVDAGVAKIAEVGGWTPQDVIDVFFNALGQVTEATLYGWEDQGARHGQLNKTAWTKGKGRKEQVLDWLERNAS